MNYCKKEKRRDLFCVFNMLYKNIYSFSPLFFVYSTTNANACVECILC